MSPTTPTETVIAQWTEPQVNPLTNRSTLLVIGGVSLFFCIILGAIGYFQKDWTFYLAAFAALVAGGALGIQRTRPRPSLLIVLTDQRLQVGRNEYDLANIAGFWFEEPGSECVINVELASGSLFPISFLYPTNNSEEARSLLLSVMPEVEPRQQTFSDKVNSFIRF